MTDKHEELRKLAEAAARLDRIENDRWYSEDDLLNQNLSAYNTIYFPKNARFIAAANPAKIIELLDEIKEQRRLLEESASDLHRMGAVSAASAITAHLRQHEGETK